MIPIKIKYAFVFFTCLLTSACSMLDTHQLHDKSKLVKLFDDYEQVKGCRYIGEIVGSEGSWYNFLFISNKELTLASINDLKNQANAMGANNINVHYNLSFNTSVPFLAQAYHCEE